MEKNGGHDLYSQAVNAALEPDFGENDGSGSDEPIRQGPRLSGERIILLIVTLISILAIWEGASLYYNSALLMPSPALTMKALGKSVNNPEVRINLVITLGRVAEGFGIAMLVGIPLGFIMGFSRWGMKLLEPLINSIRQIPIMAWVPLTIVWFGLGDGPTVFLIAFAGVFPIILNTISGVRSISPDYYNAARSMGAGWLQILFKIIVPGSLPDILTGVRLALGAGWMNVICAEFIATSSGFGYSMVEAQTRLETDTLMALMLIAALVGYLLDRTIVFLSRRFVRWKYV